MNKIYYDTVDLLNKRGIRHEVHTFASNVRMIDVWYEDKFYVFQFENDFIGFSEISGDNTGFDAIPDEKFFNDEMFNKKLSVILKE